MGNHVSCPLLTVFTLFTVNFNCELWRNSNIYQTMDIHVLRVFIIQLGVLPDTGENIFCML